MSRGSENWDASTTTREANEPVQEPMLPTLSAADIVVLRQEAATLDDTIAALERQLGQLKARRDAIHTMLSDVIYPMHTLPTELLCHVFQALVALCLPDEVNSALLAVTAVCQRWRSIAIADPHLWTTTCYILRGGPDPLFDHFLARTQGLPIAIAIEETRHTSECALTPAVLSSCHQWREADLSVADLDVHFRIESPDTELDLPHLTKLRLNVDQRTEYYNYQTFAHAPRLQDLAISYPNLIRSLGFPMHQLRKLSVLHRAAARDVLSLLPELVVLEELAVASLLRITNRDQQMVEMRSLTTLRLLGENSCVILRYLLLPRLALLHLAELDDYDADVLVRGCLSRSATDIAALSLFLVDVHCSALLMLLRPRVVGGALTCLTIAKLKATRMEQKALAALLASADFLPDLAALTLVAPSPAVLGAFWDGLARRLANAAQGAKHAVKLRQLVVQPEGMSTDDMRRLRELQRRLET
ncbi:F-box domain-containing protein [Mycena indigotica]|uniref:F-box domain-containing protein n=1 Tax=Mycena indigotica TaxID=2126181 RepID=A0A8H6T6N9_9AGAR|nr:F-box domain-containing protein [Mycena indigotica]KAF7311779.1 F-box domain-containing protein [Mycena indigotica]